METLRRELTPIRMRNYGRILQDVVKYACSIESDEERKAMTVYLAQCMRQKNLIWNRDQENGFARVKEDVLKLSDGRLSCDFPEFEMLLQAISPQKKKKK